MTHQKLILTEEAIKGHCKRLKKELKNLNQDLPLTQVQNLFSKSLRFNNFHELKNILYNQKEGIPDIVYKKIIESSKTQSKIEKIFNSACEEGDLKLVKLLFEDKNIINKPDFFTTRKSGPVGPLSSACASGNIELVKYFIEDLNCMFEENYMYIYSRHGDIFHYMSKHINLESKNQEFINNFKEGMINNCFYDYEVFEALLKLNIFEKQEDYQKLLSNTILNNYAYKTAKEIFNKNKIIHKLLNMNTSLYYNENDIFHNLMQNLTKLETNIYRSVDYKHEISRIKEIIKHLDKMYNYLENTSIQQTLIYFKNNPEMLISEYPAYNGSFIKNYTSTPTMDKITSFY